MRTGEGPQESPIAMARRSVLRALGASLVAAVHRASAQTSHEERSSSTPGKGERERRMAQNHAILQRYADAMTQAAIDRFLR